MSIPDGTKIESSQSSLNQARTLASQVIAQTPSSAPFDAAAVLQQYPEFREHKSIVVDLCYEEYCRRTEAGEDVDPREFARRFPEYEKSLLKVVQVYDFFKDDEQFAKHARLEWPVSGDDFLGFQLHEELGRGAFSRVFAAAERALGNRQVVVKICTNGNLEAQTLGQLQHPHIVPVFSVQQDHQSGLTAICMPFLGRTTLHDILHSVRRRSHWPVSARAIAEAVSENEPDHKPANLPFGKHASYADAVTRVAVQLAEAMAYTHAGNICHSDIKPSNVLLTTDGRAMLFDFNLAFAQQVAGANIGGTVPYMAPEQLRAVVDARRDRNVPIDARTDIFSFGVTLYEMLCGKMPFGEIPEHQSNREVAAELLERQQSGPAPLLSHNPNVSPSLAQLVECCLAFDPADRPQSAAALAATLRGELTLPARFWRTVRMHPVHSLIGAVFLTLLMAGITVYTATREPDDVRQFRLGTEAFQEKNYGQAEQHFTSLLAQKPNDVNALFARARARMEQRDFTGALKDFRETEKCLPDYGDGRVASWIGYCLAIEASKSKKSSDYAAAAREFRRSKVLPNAPPMATLLNNIGFCEWRSGRTNRAKRLFHSAIELDPTVQAAYFNLAEIDNREAELDKRLPDTTYIERAAELGPADGKVYFLAAEIFARSAGFARETKGVKPDEYVTAVIHYAELALQHGVPARRIERLTLYDLQLKNDARFQRLLARPAQPQNRSPRVIGLIEPLSPNPPFQLK